jgi:ketosteroid isomerase-like protein
MSSEPSENIHETIKSASDAGDVEAIVALYAPDAVMLPPNDEEFRGLEEIRAWWQDYIKYFTITSSRETEHERTVAGGIAFDRRSYSITIVPKRGPKILDDLRSLTVSKLQPDGSWKISYQMWNSIQPVGSGTNRFVSRMAQRKRPPSL